MAAEECLLEDRRLRPKVPDVVYVRPEQAKKFLNPPHARIIRTAWDEIEKIVKKLVASPSKEEFQRTRKDLFSDYFNLARIIANSFAMKAERSAQPEAIKKSFEAVRQVFETKIPRTLGQDAAQEAFFCLDTLRRAHVLVTKLYSLGDPPEGNKAADRELGYNFNLAASWAQLHLECIRYIVTGHGYKKQIIGAVLEGARHSVMAYSYARQGVEFRIKRTDPEFNDLIDDEDREILDESYNEYVEYESKINADA